MSALAQAIIDSLSRPYTINGTVVSIGASVGIVTSDYDDRTSDDLMRDADLALYAAKAAGKGCSASSSRRCTTPRASAS